AKNHSANKNNGFKRSVVFPHPNFSGRRFNKTLQKTRKENSTEIIFQNNFHNKNKTGEKKFTKTDKYDRIIDRWGHSSVGRALEWHSRGQGSDSPCLHHTEERARFVPSLHVSD